MRGSEASEGPSFAGWGIPCAAAEIRAGSFGGNRQACSGAYSEMQRAKKSRDRVEDLEQLWRTLWTQGLEGWDARRRTRLCGVSRRAVDGAAQRGRRRGLCGPGSVRYAQGGSCEPRPRHVPNSVGQHVPETP